MWKAIDFSVICGVAKCIESLGSWTISNLWLYICYNGGLWGLFTWWLSLKSKLQPLGYNKGLNPFFSPEVPMESMLSSSVLTQPELSPLKPCLVGSYFVHFSSSLSSSMVSEPWFVVWRLAKIIPRYLVEWVPFAYVALFSSSTIWSFFFWVLSSMGSLFLL